MKLLSTLSALTVLASFAWANPVITEFMADNTGTITDEDGAFSDWVEIHNPTTSPINLNQWALTDSASQLTKWRFPAVTLEPGGFLIVWASGKNRVTVGLPLHTNFSLAAGGEYLALVRPEGTVQAHFSPEFPSQQPNESFGLQFNSTTLVAGSAAVKYMVPANGALGSTWKDTAFSDTAWSSGTTGLGFGILMPGILIREVKKASGIILSLANADTLLGGTGIGSETSVVLPMLNLLGDGGDGHYANNSNYPNGAGDHFAVKATGFIVIPTAGTYTFGLSSSSGGRIRINGANVMVDDTNHGPTDKNGAVVLAAGTHTFEVVNWDEGGGEELEFYAKLGTAATTNSWDVNFKLVGDTANGGLAAFTTPSSNGGGIGTNTQTVMQNINSTVYMRRTFAATGPGTFSSLALKMKYADGFVAYLNGALLGSRNAPASPQWDSAATAMRTSAQALAAETVNVTSFLPSLINGNNVLAIHGMNDSAANGEFLALPELVAASVNSAAQPVFFAGPLATPGAVNGAYSLLGKVADTQFSVKRGVFTAPFALTITSLTAGATIRYTTDGTAPTATTGTVYSTPLNITGTTVIRAAAFKSGFEPTDVDTQSYLFPADIITQSAAGTPPPGWPSTSGTSQVLDFGMDPDIVNHADPTLGGPAAVKASLNALPSVCITMPLSSLLNIGASQGIYANPSGRGFAWERACSVEWINPPNPLQPNGSDEFQINCGIRVRGGFSRDPNNPKHGFHLFFRGDYGETKLQYPLFGRRGAEEFDQLDFRTAQNYSWSFTPGDGNANAFMREESSRQTQLDMGWHTGRLRYFHLYINGIYWGLFNTEERTEAAFCETYFGGLKDNYDVIKCEQSAGYTTGYTDGNLAAWQELWTKSKAHLSAPTNANYFKILGLAADGVTPTADPVLLDVDNLVDFLLLNFWMGNADGAASPRANNWFGARDRTGAHGGFRFFTHDFEHSLLSTGEDRTGPYINADYANFSYSMPMFTHQDLMANTEYKMKWADRAHKHMFNGGKLTPDAWLTRLNAMVSVIDSGIIAESARWGDAKNATPFTRANWVNARNGILNSIIPARNPTTLSQLRGDGLYPTLDAPTMLPFGGYVNNGTEVAMINNGGTIYYMPDGSDPRAVGGAIRAGALIYTSAIVNDPIVAFGSAWKYLADGSNQGTAWRAPAFNDAAWTTGNTELGYGDGDEALPVVPFVDVDPVTAGVQKNATTYFRKTFNVTNAAGLIGANLTIEFDDAALIYLNGNFLGATPGITNGAAFDYYSGAAIEDTTNTFTVPLGALLEGANTLAVEVHQANNGSSDLSFNCSLTGLRTGAGSQYFITGAGVRPLKVRALSGGAWSAMVDATFLVNTEPATASNLVISEIMYNPTPATAAEVAAGFANSDDFEFIELTNIGTKHVDLDDVYFYGAIDFNFTGALTGRTLAPGGRVIVASKRTAFEFRYGTGLPVAGSYKGNLGNGGETVRLYFPNDSVLRALTYTDFAPWPAAADGTGRSLVLKRPTTNPDHTAATSWRASTTTGGAPGGVDSMTLAAFNTANGISNPLADNDNDSLNNFLEYALGGNPNNGGQAELPDLGANGGFATFTFTRPGNADDLAYTVEGTTDLATPASWSAANVVLLSSVENLDGTATVVYRSAQPINSTARQYMRLRVTELP